MSTPSLSLVAAALGRAYLQIPSHWIAEVGGRSTKRLTEAFKQAEENLLLELQKAGLEAEDANDSPVLAKALFEIRRARLGFDPRGGKVVDQARGVADHIALMLAVATINANDEIAAATV